MSDWEEKSKYACPLCGTFAVSYDLTCHTYPQRNADGAVRFMACLPCDSAVEYLCEADGCDWRYTDGLNPENPSAGKNALSKPEWLTERHEYGIEGIPYVMDSDFGGEVEV